ncbi:MAG: glycosyltransferase [Hyphomonas sp.]
MSRVYVVGAAIPNGGTFMAYHLGHILQTSFGFSPFAVQVKNETWDHGKHVYPSTFPLVSIAQMESMIRSEDVLIANPSFSPHMFGLRLPGKKICYAQGFSTFTTLDARFDLYVSVSGFVRDYLAGTYGLQTQVIPPFLEPHGLESPKPWKERPSGKVLSYLKGPIARVFYERLQEIIGSDVDLSDVVGGNSLPRRELLSRIAASRYLLSLSPAEGFGLVPVEAMSLGTVVCGFDGFGGREYFRNMGNGAVSAYPDIEGVARQLLAIVEDENLAESISRNGHETAREFSYEKFRGAWTGVIAQLLGTAELP